jgi:hypothetical protein
LRRVVVKFQNSFPGVQADTQQPMRDIDQLLMVPFINAGKRMELLQQTRNASYHLNTSKASGVEGLTPQQNSANVKKTAKWQSRLAVAALGKPDPIDAYRQVAARVYDDTDKGRIAPLDKAHDLLRPAALQARQLPGSAPAAWPTLDPVGENRRVEMHALLFHQARRAFDDYWASNDPKEPYYRAAGQAYLTAAKALAAGDNPDLKKARITEADVALDDLLAKDDTLTPRWLDGADAKTGSAVWHITDEDRVARSFKLEKAASAPDGIPVVWTELGQWLKPVKETDLERRALVRDKNEPADAPIEYEFTPEHPKNPETLKDKSRLGFTGFFRGRAVTLETTVWVHHLPEITSYQPEFPLTGRVAIKSSLLDYQRFAAANSELVIVVDYSGSMTKITKETKNKNERSRKQAALAALEKALPSVPKGVKVTLLTFSDTEGGGAITPQWKQVEWNPEAEAVSDRINQLAKLHPDFDTPLVGATVEAKKYFTPGFGGSKSVLILTDGGDNYFLTDLYKKRDDWRHLDIRKGDTMEKYLRREFDGTGILVNVIGIETDDLNAKDDPDEFPGLNEYKPAIEKIGGKFVPVKDSAALVHELEQFLLQIHYRVDGESGAVPAGKEEGEISRSDKNVHWIQGLRPGDPNLRSGTFMVNMLTNRRTEKASEKKAFEQRIRLEGGDALVLSLQPVPDGKSFMFRREMYADAYSIKKLNKVIAQQEPLDKAWLASVLQNQRTRETGRLVHPLQIMTALEKRDDPAATSKTPLRVVRPQFVWFNVSIKDAPGVPVPGLRFYPLADYPAPAYSLDLPEWTKGKEPILDAWWTEDAPPDCGILRPEAGKRLMDLKQHALEVRPTNQEERSRIVVESIRYESRTVELTPGAVPKPDVDCVVVRLRWDPEQANPFFALLPEAARATGAEHRFYLEAGKYTGVFFNVSKENLQALDRLILYSVEGARSKAQAQHVSLNLGTPNTDDRPAKPQD